MKLKTTYWDSNLNSEWRQKIGSLIYVFQIFILTNCFVFAILTRWFWASFNALALLITFLMQRSYKKWRKENGTE